ncbi:ABC transporter permease [Plastorhodobacter daqingensis]|uniref:Nitrate/sulfonate/bicarbonate ABC transporter permease n=2 Tax=Rhodobacterales TaxID=204455 RepID=A0A0B5DUH2_9RHOB|nr:ABC transporter permease subunit [Celeribacter indicus]AJE46664.1 nitrate/sulfonate/bicarbonate ABC transporter permease [Celeribacter indicus]SDX56878.1 NitT/TauT family transport system permease protein [Celeribacter indicus]
MTLSRERAQDVFYGVLGIVLFLAAWEYIGQNQLAGLTWPPLTTVIAYLTDPDRRPLFLRATSATFSMVGLGYLLGALLGALVAGLAHLVQPMREGLGRLSSVINAVPSIALAPLFIVLLSQEWTGMAIATLNVYFVIFVAAGSGLNAASTAHHDLFTTFGSNRFLRLLQLELPAALPALVSGLKYAVPASFIGAIIGEWFGSSRGLGLLMVSSMQNFQIPLLWSAVVIAAAGSLSAFGLMGLIERFVYGRFR